MNGPSLVAVGGPVVGVLAAYIASRFVNGTASAKRGSANSLVVLSGMLTALAILIPVGATLLPDKHFGWKAWLLVGALISGVVCIFGTIYSMISLQDETDFTPNACPYIPSWINATWVALSA